MRTELDLRIGTLVVVVIVVVIVTPGNARARVSRGGVHPVPDAVVRASLLGHAQGAEFRPVPVPDARVRCRAAPADRGVRPAGLLDDRDDVGGTRHAYGQRSARPLPG